MQGAQILAMGFLRDHPDEAAAVLEGRPADEVADLLAEAPAELTATLLQRMTTPSATACLRGMPSAAASAAAQMLPVGTLAGLVRQMDATDAEVVLRALPRGARTGLERILRYPEDTAGALMDPRVTALPQDITVENATARLRKLRQASIYYYYVVDREQHLVGVLTVRELLLAPRRELLSQVMHAPVERLPAETQRKAILGHPAWQVYHALPVVDEEGRFVGVMRYETLRRLEREEVPSTPTTAAMETAMRLGELIWIGFAGVFAGLPGSMGPVSASNNRTGRD
jgi:magnesium transporter